MQRTSIVILVAVVLTLGMGAGPRMPVARVLEVKGKASIIEAEGYERPAAVYGTIYADESLAVNDAGQVTLIFREDGHVERVVAAGKFQVAKDGCRPKQGVEQVKLSDKSRTAIGRIGKGSRGIVQGGVVMPRAPAPRPKEDEALAKADVAAIGQSKEVSPLVGTTLLVSKPKFSWPALADVKAYTLTLSYKDDRVWSVETDSNQTEYAGETSLKPGALYAWEVTATVDGKPVAVHEGVFRMATDKQRAEIAAIREVLAKPSPVALAAAALWYHQNGFLAEAIAANQELAKLSPEVGVYRELAELWFQVGRVDQGEAAMAKAGELEKKVEGK